MKKCVAAFVLVALLFCGCSASSQEKQPNYHSPVESYKVAAQQHLNNRNLEAAIDVLEEGIAKTNSQELIDMLSGIQVETTMPAVDVLTINNTQYRINLFLSNFAETRFYAYPCDDYEVLRFVREHCYYNNDGDITTRNGRDYLAKKTVDEVMYKYFAVTLSDNISGSDYYSTDMKQSVHYSNQQYSYESTPYAYNGYVGIAKSMFQDSYGYYQVEYDVYYVDPNYISEYTELFYLTADQAKNYAHMSYAYSGEAVVQDYLRTNGKQSYQLITLKTLG